MCVTSFCFCYLCMVQEEGELRALARLGESEKKETPIIYIRQLLYLL